MAVEVLAVVVDLSSSSSLECISPAVSNHRRLLAEETKAVLQLTIGLVVAGDLAMFP